MTPRDAKAHTSDTRPRRRLLTVLLAAVACSVCLVPALATTAALATITGWFTGTPGLAIAAGMAAATAGLLWARRRNRDHPVACGCGGCR